MSYYLVQQASKLDYNYKEFICNTREEKNLLPTDCAPGSVCLVVEDSSVWVLNTDKEWCELK